MTTAVREAPHHRNLTCYTDYKCRLPECVERRRLWQQDRRRKQREGQAALVDAEPVRQHLLALQTDGISTYRAALIAGVDDWTVRAFMPSRDGRRIRKNRTTPEVARKILAITAEAATSGYTDGTGTRRRIQALAANGWPLSRLATHLGLNPTYVGDLLRTPEQRVYATTAAKVARGYNQIKKQKPARHGIAAHIAKRTRLVAKAKRWPTPKYWDQFPDAIDDPHFQPLYGVTNRELIAIDASELIRWGGLDRAAAAERLGVDKSYLDHALTKHPQTEQELAA
ncbi:hypothetical protein ACWD3J_14235 [Streptomyces sp. NPDC002755]